MRNVPTQEGQRFLVSAVFAVTAFLVVHASVLAQDQLIVTPDKPKWGDTLRFELHPAKERGRLYLYYTFSYPLGETTRGWVQLHSEDGIYTAPPTAVDTNSIRMWVEVRGQHYLETVCPFLPFKDIRTYATNGRPADEALGDTSKTMLFNWYDMAHEDMKTAKAYIRELEERRPQTLPNCYVIAEAYFSLGEDEKALTYLRKMHQMDPSSPLILRTVGGIFGRSREIMDEVQNRIVGFLEKNVQKPISWETLSSRFDSIPDSVARKVLNTWHSAEPENPIPLYYLASLSRKAARLDQALRFIGRAIALEKEDFLIVYAEYRSQVAVHRLEFHKLRGDVQHQRGEVQAAIRDYEQATAVTARTDVLIPVYLRLGSLYAQCEQEREAELYWFKAYIAGDTTDSESTLTNMHSRKHYRDMTFRQYLRQLYEEVKSDYRYAPDFETTDANRQRAALSDNEGRLTVLYFWSPDCAPCVVMIPCLNQIREEFMNRGVDFWAIGHADEQFLRVHPFKFRIIPPYIDLWQKYNITATPQSFVIGPDGRIIYHMIGGSQSVCDTLRRILKRAGFILG